MATTTSRLAGLDDLDLILKELEHDLDTNKDKRMNVAKVPTIPVRSQEADLAFDHLKHHGGRTSGQGLERWQYKGFGIWESNGDELDDELEVGIKNDLIDDYSNGNDVNGTNDVKGIRHLLRNKNDYNNVDALNGGDASSARKTFFSNGDTSKPVLRNGNHANDVLSNYDEMSDYMNGNSKNGHHNGDHRNDYSVYGSATENPLQNKKDLVKNKGVVDQKSKLVAEQVAKKNSKNAHDATRELDDLMNSLSSFQMSQDETSNSDNNTECKKSDKIVEEKPVTLDNMLLRLKDELKNEGVIVKEKGACYTCGKPILGQVITALGKTFHPECFVCAHCQEPIGTANFFERDGQSYCEKDYHFLFSPKCAECLEPIMDRCVTAMGRTYHPRCFRCCECRQPFGDAGFHERDGKAFCQKCFSQNFAPKCAKCQQPICGPFVSALGKEWHTECFVCAECEMSFDDGQYFEHAGLPFCETHFHALKGSLCDKCQKPISGRCITAMSRKFHPECFVCVFCLRQLNKGTFKERADKPYCHDCFDRLFG